MWKVLNDAGYWLAARAAKSYTAPTIDDTRQICTRLEMERLGSSLCFWNDDSDSVENIVHASLQLLEILRDLEPRSYLSLKLPAIYFNSTAVKTILRAAARRQRLVHFDSHGPEHADRMFTTIERAFKYNRNLGCTIPGRWVRSIDDARIACQWGLRVRVVKGQWPDPRQPQVDMRRGFLNVVDELCGRAGFVAIASHDIALSREALHRLQNAGTPCELELLYGLPRRAAVQMAKALAVPIRIYLPQGKAWLPYVLKQARRNPRVLSWFARDLVRGSVFSN